MSENDKIFDQKRNDDLNARYHRPDEILALDLTLGFNGPSGAEDVGRQPRKRGRPPGSSANRNGAPPKTRTAKASVKTRKQSGLDLSFYVASEKTQAKLDKLMAGARASSEFSFTPVFVTKPREGGVYVYPGLGPVKCEGLGPLDVAGTSISVISFKELEMTGSSVMRVVPERIQEKHIRELAPAEVLDDLVQTLKNGAKPIRGFPSHQNQQKAMFEKARLSSDLPDMVRLLNHAFSTKKIGEHSGHEITFGNCAVNQIAAEYAYVKGVPFDDAKDLIQRATGLPTIKQLRYYIDGRGGRRRGPA